MKLEKVKFLDLTCVSELSKNEQQLLLGGYGKSSCCWWESGTDMDCTGSAAEAYHMGGHYHWECNTAYATKKCGC